MLTEWEEWLVEATVHYAGWVERWRLVKLYDDLWQADGGIRPDFYMGISAECEKAVLAVLRDAIADREWE